MDKAKPQSRENEREDKSPIPPRVNWWGIFGLLCGIGSAYLSLRIFFEAITLLGKGP
jgi:hypothetical protein